MTQPTSSPPWIATLAPYVPGKPASELERELGITNIVKLASNEAPPSLSRGLLEAMRAAADSIHLYPDPAAWALRAQLGAQLGVPMERVVVGNGSNELITLLVRTFASPGQNIVAPATAFIAYRICAQASGVAFKPAAERDFTCDVDSVIRACDDHTQIAFVANPNNPTGTHIGRDALVRLLREVPAHVLLVIDEAYFEYADPAEVPDTLELLGERENLVVLRTFSKAYGLAGLRVGYGVVPAYVAERLHRVRDPFNVNSVAQAAASFVLRDTETLRKVVGANTSGRLWVTEQLGKLGLHVWPSQGNFVMFDTPHPSGVLNDALLRRGVIIRPLGPYGLPTQIRVTIGTPAENTKFIEALTDSLHALKA